MEEIWLDIHGYEGVYQVSNLGRVKSLSRIVDNTTFNRKTKERILKQHISMGYLYVRLYKDKQGKAFRVHRLVATSFLPNPNNCREVNHKDENKLNNNLVNLEWCDRLYNRNYGTCIERAADKHKKRVVQYSLKGDLMKIYGSIKEASENTGLLGCNIVDCCKGRRKTVGGYFWAYE